jgi:tRNA A58 N-methylase Trm61
MPTDTGLIVANLTTFYEFRQKLVVHVGAGGGQLLGYAPASRKVLAVDKDAEAVRLLERRIADRALEDVVTAITGDFRELQLASDVVLLEFCLHEMPEPRAAIDHARALAPDVVVIDHLPESPWSWYADEAEDMARAWEAVAAAGTRQRRSYQAYQHFESHRQLRDRFAAQGEESWRRIAPFQGQTGIEIPMPYGIALLRGASQP